MTTVVIEGQRYQVSEAVAQLLIRKEEQISELQKRVASLEFWIGIKPGAPLAYLEALEAEHEAAMRALGQLSSVMSIDWQEKVAAVEAAKGGTPGRPPTRSRG